MKPLFALCVPLLAIVCPISGKVRAPQAAPKSEPQALQENDRGKADKKELEARAKQLIAEGRTLEQQGKPGEAKDKYVDAEGVLSTSDALSAIARINDQQKKDLQSLLSEAGHSYGAGKLSDSVQQLQHGLEMDPANPALLYDLALCYLKLDDRPNAALRLDLAAGAVSRESDRRALLEIHSVVLMGTFTTEKLVDARGSRVASAFNQSYLQEDRDPRDSRAAGRSLCDQTKELQDAFPTDAAVVFNSAKCAAEDARPEDAAHELGQYVKLAPEALDRTEAALYQQTLSSLASLSAESGQLVRQDYATAARYLDYRRYDRAIAAYESAAQVLPDFPQTQWQLGLLYEAYGNVAKARAHFSRFEQVEPDPARKSDAEPHFSTLDSRRAVYDANIAEAQDIMTGLLLPSLGLNSLGTKHKTKLSYRQWRWASRQYKETTRATEKLSQPYVERELGRARDDLESATELFPLGAEANELLALIDLQGNNWPEAYRNYDAVASQGFPVSFYAQVNSSRDRKVVRATKVEIGTDAIRLVYLSSYDTKKRISAPPSKPAGEDDLGNLVVSAAQPPDAQAQALTIRPAELMGIETDKNFVVLKLRSDRIYIAPLDMLAEVPFEGGASRTFGNEYTRLFVRYLGYEEAKLGKEGMTTGEKFKLGFEIARIGVSIGMMGVGAPAAYGSAVRVARLIHALAVYHEVGQGVRAVNVADSATRLVDDVQMAAATLERVSSDERRAVGGMEFKVLPTQQVQFKFREKF
jgi:tetratricopeptide (TPR) repeat protein